jgi:hypothetical protein
MTRALKTTIYASLLAGFITGAALPVFAPAQAQDSLTPEAITKDQKQASCIFFARLHDWTPIDNTNMILWASRTQPYHVQLTPPCHGLRFAIGIGFSSRSGSRRLCTMDAVIVDNGPGIPERCLIQEMIELDDSSLKALLAQAPGRAEGREEARDRKDTAK